MHKNLKIQANDNLEKNEFINMCPVSLTSIETYVKGMVTNDNENLTNLIESKGKEFSNQLADLSHFLVKIPNNDAGNPKNLDKFEDYIIKLKTIMAYLEWYIKDRSTSVDLEEPTSDLAYAILHKDSYNVEKGQMIFTSIKKAIFNRPFKTIILKAAKNLLQQDMLDYVGMILVSTFAVLLESSKKYSHPTVLVAELVRQAFDRLGEITITEEDYQVISDKLKFIYVQLPANIIQFVWVTSNTYCIQNKKEKLFFYSFYNHNENPGPKIAVGISDTKQQMPFSITLSEFFFYKIESLYYNQLRVENPHSAECPFAKQLEMQSWELQPSTDDNSFYIKANSDWYWFIKDGKILFEDLDTEQLKFYDGSEWLIETCK